MPQVMHTGGHNTGIGLKNESCLLAKAIYNNVAENPGELSFSKGDTLTVLEQDPCSLSGWWLCSFKGQRGLCPGNRLRLMNSNNTNKYDGIIPKLESPNVWLPSDSNYVYAVHFAKQPPLSSSLSATPSPSNTLSRQPHRRQHDNDSDYEDVDKGEKEEEEESCYDVPPSPIPINPYHRQQEQQLTPTRHRDDIEQQEYRLSPHSVSCDSGVDSSYDTYDVPRHLTAGHSSADVTDARRRVTAVNGGPLLTNRSAESKIKHSHLTHDSTSTSTMDSTYIASTASTTSSSSTSSSMGSIGSSNRSSSSVSSGASVASGSGADYDVPRPFAGAVRPALPPRPAFIGCGRPAPPPRPSPSCRGGVASAVRAYDVPPNATHMKELPLELSPALETLEHLENEAVASITKLLDVAKAPPTSSSYTGTLQRSSDANNIHVAIVRFRGALSALAEFAEGVLGNATKASDKNLAGKLRPLVEVLQNSAARIHSLTDDRRLGGEEVEGVVLCAVGLLDEVKQVASFVQGNSTLLFKRDSTQFDLRKDKGEPPTPTPTPPPAPHSSMRLTPTTLTPGSPPAPAPASTAPGAGVITLCSLPLTGDDRAVLTFYARQAARSAARVTDSIDRLLQAVEQSQPPRVFVERAKHLVVNAHALVHVADAVVRGVANAEVKSAVEKAADALSEGLATHVQETRKAAEHFPSVQAVQEMVNSVAEVGHLSRTVKCTLLQAAQPQDTQLHLQ